MGQNGQRLTLYELVTYRIRVQGVLDPGCSEYVGGMAISTDSEGGQYPVTTLSGQLLDQAALLGVLNLLYNRRLPILLVECLA